MYKTDTSQVIITDVNCSEKHCDKKVTVYAKQQFRICGACEAARWTKGGLYNPIRKTDDAA